MKFSESKLFREIKLFVRRVLSNKMLNILSRIFVKRLQFVLPSELVIRKPVTTPITCKIDGISPFKIASDVRDPVVRSIYWKGTSFYEPMETQIVIAALQTCEIMFDIGAYIGWYTLVALCLPNIRAVYGFEPCLDTYQLYKRNIDINGFAHGYALQFAISDRTGNADFFVPAATGKLSLEASLRQTEHTIQHKVSVKTTTVDEFIISNNIKQVDFMKIDVETFETQVLRGATRVLDVDQPIILIEILPEVSIEELRSIFDGRSYRFFKVTDNGMSEYECLEPDQSYHNWLLVPERNWVRM